MRLRFELPPVLRIDLNGDLAARQFGRRHSQLQDAIVVAGPYLIALDALGQGYRALDSTVRNLPPEMVAGLLSRVLNVPADELETKIREAQDAGSPGQEAFAGNRRSASRT